MTTSFQEQHDKNRALVSSLSREELELIVGDVLVCLQEGRLIDSSLGYEYEEGWFRAKRPSYPIPVCSNLGQANMPTWHSLIPLQSLLPYDIDAYDIDGPADFQEKGGKVRCLDYDYEQEQE